MRKLYATWIHLAELFSRHHFEDRQQQTKMDNAQQHWKLLNKLGKDLANKVREFMVIGYDGEGLLVITKDGQGFWLGEMKFGAEEESKTATEPTLLNVPELVQMAHGQSHILLLNKQGEVYSMGQNVWGQLGLGTKNEETHFSPQLISCPHQFTSVRCGDGHSLALTENGKAWAWGENCYGQVGVPTSNYSLSSPRQISELNSHRVIAIECGGYHSLALTDQGEVYAWGENRYGQLGNGSKTHTHIPTQIPTPSPVKSMAVGSIHTLLLTQTGEVYACGSNQEGQLGLPSATESSANLVKVAGLPFISQIASHSYTELSIAMSSYQRCFVWGQLADGTSIFTPRELPPFYSTVESPLSFYSTFSNTSHSFSIPENLPILSARMSRMFDNPKTSDVQFLVEEKTIHAHRIILRNSSDYFARMFSETWQTPVDPEDPIVKVTITDHSYEIFHAFIHLLYTDYFKVQPDLLPELFELAIQYLVPDLQRLCLSQMRETLTPATCCLYYPLTLRHSLLPELATFQQELVQFVSTRMSKVIATTAFQSMDADSCKKLTISIANLSNR